MPCKILLQLNHEIKMLRNILYESIGKIFQFLSCLCIICSLRLVLNKTNHVCLYLELIFLIETIKLLQIYILQNYMKYRFQVNRKFKMPQNPFTLKYSNLKMSGKLSTKFFFKSNSILVVNVRVAQQIQVFKVKSCLRVSQQFPKLVLI